MTFDDLTSDDRQLPEPMAEGPNADPGMLNRGRIVAEPGANDRTEAKRKCGGGT